MTGFGRGETSGRGRTYTVEVQSVNHRFLEVRCRLPKRLAGLEPRFQRAVQQRFARGHVEMSIQEKDLEGRGRTLKVDLPLARQYVELLRALQREMDLPGQVTLEMLAGQRELISIEESEDTVEEVWDELEPALLDALDALTTMRCREGAALVEALRRHLDEIDGTLSRVVERTADLVTAHRNRLRERVADLLDGRLPDPLRLEQEVALLAERGDVAEECDRLRSHLAQFRATLDLAGPQGRRLDFLLQEMNREANTIGSKAADAGLAHDVVSLKTSIERLREQVQNLE
ncbi:MAG: YicC family protein [Zetaproteobacteria bacterium]|nr:MAG: YicC family protein [Zetaproteobacteria bacterium]